MAAHKKQKTELIALYRLEFYKKQKNWKLATDARKEKEFENKTAPSKDSKVLNETYSIETNAHDASMLNDAFLKDDSDKDLPVSPEIHNCLKTQWLEPINACEECQHADTKPRNLWADYVDNGPLSTDAVAKCSGDGLYEFEGFNGWEGMVWTNSSVARPGRTGDVPAPMNPNVAECPPQLGWPTDTLLPQLDCLGQRAPWPDDQMWVPDIWRDDELLMESLESLDEFMMGAHSAPHSSEVDFRLKECDGDDGALDGSPDWLSRMSGAALSAAVLRHTGSLRRLLREANHRRKHRSTLSLDLCAPDHFGLASRDFFSTDCSYDAFPTRDVPSAPVSLIYLRKDEVNHLHPENQYDDRYNPLSPKIQRKESNDQHKYSFTPLSSTNQCQKAFTPPTPEHLDRGEFLAGSHRNKVPSGFVGRGRGRLQGGGV